MPSSTRATLIDSISTAIMRWQEATQAFDDAVGEKLGLSSAERQCLGALHEGAKPAGAIAKAIGLTPAAVTALIDRLEERGLLERQRSSEDRRQVHVRLTDRAMKETMKFYGPIAAEGHSLLSSMTIAELDAIKAFLDKTLALQQHHLERIRRGAVKGAERKRTKPTG